ncbi:MAG: hypothetical protein KDD45_13205 [Bdellovibrionales bacterium]|nr:hypothetical protein [Bdellovibrionales bacterium]
MKNILKILTTSTIFFSFIACGPVKFSSSSNQPASDDQPVTPTDSNTGSGTDTGTGSGTTTQTRDVTTTYTVNSSTENKVDIVLVIDNSSSMEADNQKLADRLTTFVSQLESSSIDWQMCLTVTTYIPNSGTNYWGMSINWSDYSGAQKWLLKKGTSNLSTIFKNTILNNIATGSMNTNDERAIKAAYWHVGYKNYNNCYRTGAALAYIIISDEDERSIGGDATYQYYADEYKTLDQDDQPSALVDKVKSMLGSDVRFRANSIIVKSDDATCLQTEDDQGTKAHYGKKYEELSKMTGGGIGSICDTDYATNLNYFNEVINDSLASMPLECNPVGNNIAVTISPASVNVTSTIQGQSLVFSPSVPVGSTIVAKYKCALANNGNRIPSSVEEPSLLTKLYTWIIEPIINFFK